MLKNVVTARRHALEHPIALSSPAPSVAASPLLRVSSPLWDLSTGAASVNSGAYNLPAFATADLSETTRPRPDNFTEEEYDMGHFSQHSHKTLTPSPSPRKAQQGAAEPRASPTGSRDACWQLRATGPRLLPPEVAQAWLFAPHLADVRIDVEGSAALAPLHAHRFVLEAERGPAAATSPLMKVAAPEAGGNGVTVALRRVPRDLVEAAVTFIYTGQAQWPEGQAVALASLAALFDVPSLIRAAQCHAAGVAPVALAAEGAPQASGPAPGTGRPRALPLEPTPFTPGMPAASSALAASAPAAGAAASEARTVLVTPIRREGKRSLSTANTPISPVLSSPDLPPSGLYGAALPPRTWSGRPTQRVPDTPLNGQMSVATARHTPLGQKVDGPRERAEAGEKRGAIPFPAPPAEEVKGREDCRYTAISDSDSDSDGEQGAGREGAAGGGSDDSSCGIVSPPARADEVRELDGAAGDIGGNNAEEPFGGDDGGHKDDDDEQHHDDDDDDDLPAALGSGERIDGSGNTAAGTVAAPGGTADVAAEDGKPDAAAIAAAGVPLDNPNANFDRSHISIADDDDDDNDADDDREGDAELPSVLGGASGEIVATPRSSVRSVAANAPAFASTPGVTVISSSEQSPASRRSRVRPLQPSVGRGSLRDVSLFAPGTPQDPLAGVSTGENSPPRRSDSFLLQLLDEPCSPRSASQQSTASKGEAKAVGDEDATADAAEDAGVTGSQAAAAAAVPVRLAALIRETPALYGAVLRMETLVLSHLQAAVKEAGIRCGRDALVDFCDAQGITWTDPRPKVARTRKRKKKKAGPRKPAAAKARGSQSQSQAREA